MLTNQERNTLGIKLTEIAVGYGKEFPKEQAKIYINALVNYLPNTLENYLLALNRYISDQKNKFFPTPFQLRNYLENKPSIDTLANETASRIRSAITKFGWPNPEGAKEYIGDLGWKIVERNGGWLSLCENHGLVLNPQTFHAQSRDLAKSMIESAELGIFDQPIKIPEPRKEDLTSIGNILKPLLENKQKGGENERTTSSSSFTTDQENI